MSQDLVRERKLEASPQELEAELLVWIQRLLDQGDHDQADRLVLVSAVRAVRELADLRMVVNPPEMSQLQQLLDHLHGPDDFDC